MNRSTFLALHRYAGLFMALFLVVAGSTGAALAFYDELDHALNPRLFSVAPRDTPMPLASLTETVEQQALESKAKISFIRFTTEPTDTIELFVTATLDPATQEPYQLNFDRVFVDPYTGELLGTRLWGAWRLDRAHLMPLLFELHYSLALPSPWGIWLFGAAGLLWVFDCFVGFYLTLPRSRRLRRNQDGPEVSASGREPSQRGLALNKWKKAWRIKWSAGSGRVLRDVHVAVSLWLWGMLLMLAVSSVMFNLFDEVYRPVLKNFVAYERVRDTLPDIKGPIQPRLGFAEAATHARALMAEWQDEQGFTIHSEDSLAYDKAKNAYRYRVKSTLDLPQSYSQTRLYISAADGQLLAREHAYLDTGNAITTWLAALHMGRVFGLWYQLVISLMGVVVTTVTVTGVTIWWRKRKRQLATTPQPRPARRSDKTLSMASSI